MQTKLFEIRDIGTFIPAIATLMEPEDERDGYLLRRAGYGIGTGLVLFTRLDGGPAHYDFYDWPAGTRTMRVAHEYIAGNWQALTTGDVICVETILGERETPKISERLEQWPA
jgi:hypothetical protein